MKSTTNKYSTSNRKLGPGVISFSRLVGLTCPTECAFLGHGCYAERLQNFRANIAKSYTDNTILDVEQAVSQLKFCLNHSMPLRLHVAGDWGLDGELDLDYLHGWGEALSIVRRRYGDTPKVWAYTHMYNPLIVSTFAPFDNVSIYASCHTEEDIAEARAAGFTLFALASTYTQKSQSKEQLPVKIFELGEEWTVCPEQRLKGTSKKVTCSTCKMCINGHKNKKNVLFLKH